MIGIKKQDISIEIKEKAEAKLKDNFENVNRWLQFAEAKNGALLAINTAILMGFLAVVTNTDTELSKCGGIYVFWAIILIVISSVITLLSFSPDTDRLKDNKGSAIPRDILMLYSNIVKYNEEEYVKEIYKRYLEVIIYENFVPTALEIEYSQEIIYNAKITNAKYKYFRMASLITIIAIGGPIGIIGIWINYMLKQTNEYSNESNNKNI